jgi:hypothetical protein
MLQTSFYQNLEFLNGNKKLTALDEKNLNFCRHCIGEDLILRSSGGSNYKFPYGIAGSEQEKTFRLELRSQVASLENEAVLDLCQRNAAANGGKLIGNPYLKNLSGCSEKLGAAANKMLDPNGVHALEARIKKLAKQNAAMKIYVFGHTHEAKLYRPVQLAKSLTIPFNSGAFQRLMDRNFFDKSKKPPENDVDLLNRLTHNDMKACYTTVAITYNTNKTPNAEIKQWIMTEDPSAEGNLLSGCSLPCSALPVNCWQ